MDIVYLLERLEEVIESARHVPFGTRVMIDGQDCLDIIDQIRLALPGELNQARRVIVERDQILAEADERANRVVQRAEEQAANRVDEHSVLLAAEDRARAILEQARREADQLRRESEEYAYRVFTSLHERLQKIESVVQDGIDNLWRDSS